MESLNILLDMWREDKNIERIIDANISLQSIDVQAFLDSLPPHKQEVVRSELVEIISHINSFMSDMDEKKNQILVQLDQNSGNSKACLSYASASSLGKSTKRDG